MICRQVLGTVADDAEGVDWVEIDWPQTLRRALRLVSNAGTRIDILLPPGGRLQHGDILFASENTQIVIFLRLCDVLALYPASREAAMRLALRLGNLHLSAEVAGDAIFVPNDGPALELAEAEKVPFTRQRRRFFPDVGLKP